MKIEVTSKPTLAIHLTYDEAVKLLHLLGSISGGDNHGFRTFFDEMYYDLSTHTKGEALYPKEVEIKSEIRNR